MTKFSGIPENTYGILQRDSSDLECDEIAEHIRRLGYAILDSGYTPAELRAISETFDRIRAQYVDQWGEERLRSCNEIHTIRALLTHGGAPFMKLASNKNLLALLRRLIVGKFILNQQNGVINPPGETYNQGGWHRDLPYQHYVSSSPLAVNALFCLDDFTFENGATFVLPASHKAVAYPSNNYVRQNALQVEAKAGQFIVLDCMIFHSGGFNSTNKARRAINHVYTIPYFKQQINLPKNMSAEGLSDEERELIGFDYQEPASIEQYLSSRVKKEAGNG